MKWKYKLLIIVILLVLGTICITGIMYTKKVNLKTDLQNKFTKYITNNLSDKLITTQGGIWVLKKSDGNLNYTYVFEFSKGNKVIFSYSTIDDSTRKFTYNVLREGTFEIKNNILTINFSTVIGNQYGRPNLSDEPLQENLSIKFKAKIEDYPITVKEHLGKLFYLENPGYVNKDIEITEYKLILTQISGKNIFNDYGKNATIELVAERPIID